MTRYLVAALAGVTFAFTGQPSGLRLLVALAISNAAMYVWARISGGDRGEVKA